MGAAGVVVADLREIKPEIVRELEAIGHCIDSPEDKRRYMDSLRNYVLSPSLERSIKATFNLDDLTKIRKSRRRYVKTFDFYSKSGQILLEVTSINYGTESQVNVTRKIRRAIEHIGEKTPYRMCRDYFSGGMIVYSPDMASRHGELTAKILDRDFVIPMIRGQRLDYVLFGPWESPGGDCPPGTYPSVLYVKKELREKFSGIAANICEFE